MPRKSLEVDVKPAVMKYFIESSGWAAEKLSGKIKVSQPVIQAWLEGGAKPTLNQLERLSAALKRPLAAFLLPEPPKEKPLPKDYRTLPGKEGRFDKNTILALRRARRLQKISKELSENLRYSPKSAINSYSAQANPKNVGREYRELFKITEDVQKIWKTPYDAFSRLRDVIEEKNILVFQMPMPLEDARGFTLVDDDPAVIVVNLRDQIEAKIFTLMHEFGHVLLKESGVSLGENSLIVHNADKVEKWCNEFASSFLLPEEMANAVFGSNKAALTDTATLNSLSRAYKVSKCMLLYNMQKLGYINNEQREEVLGRYKPAAKKEPKAGEKKGGGFKRSAEKKCMSEMGQKFVSLVISNMERGNITQRDALDYLSIKSKNLDKVTNRLKK